MSENEKKPNEELNEESLEQVSGGVLDPNKNVPETPETTQQCPNQHTKCTEDNCLNANCGFLINTQQIFSCGKGITGFFNIHS